MLGDRTLESGSLTEARSAFSEALKKDPGHAGAALGLGLCLELAGEHSRAAEMFDRVARMRGLPSELSTDAVFNRGVARGHLGDSEAAIASADVRSLALLNSGIALTQLQRTADAIGRFEECLALRPGAECAHTASGWLIRLHLENGRPQEAAHCMSRLHHFEPAETPIERRLEARISTITTAARDHGPDAAALLLDASLKGDPEEIRARMAFLGPAIDYAKTGAEQALSGLGDRERDAARQIAAAITGLTAGTRA